MKVGTYMLTQLAATYLASQGRTYFEGEESSFLGETVAELLNETDDDWDDEVSITIHASWDEELPPHRIEILENEKND